MSADYEDKANTHDFCKLKSQVPMMVKEIIKEKKLCDDCIESLECPQYGLLKDCVAKRVLVNSHAGMEF
jgi:hypothetical protein